MMVKKQMFGAWGYVRLYLRSYTCAYIVLTFLCSFSFLRFFTFFCVINKFLFDQFLPSFFFFFLIFIMF